MSKQAWREIASAPTNESVLVFIPNWDHYGPGIYRGILVDMGSGQHWMTTALAMGRDLDAVIGYCGTSGSGKGARWVVRCACGMYSVRITRSVKNPANQDDRCERCRQQQFFRNRLEYSNTERKSKSGNPSA